MTENPDHLSLRALSPNPIGVINRRNGCGTTLFKKGLTENFSNVVGVIKQRTMVAGQRCDQKEQKQVNLRKRKRKGKRKNRV
ncbi:hypothetical protein MSKOL_2190 [Methanosarcina sp. Kolksee]|uniref:hypothetical protein n=1 Tax=Methanosarcina sp. Kolksee TaxID=1434099 RepID=UPI0006161E4A|nr:hypothetical protein [Methanosarcina sp. Kolksee]AKB47967.1 hypothetical protein MSKOL_2190 [Methanosarcina sp. Kolksee]